MKKFRSILTCFVLLCLISCEKNIEEPQVSVTYPYEDGEVVFGCNTKADVQTRTSYGDETNINIEKNKVLIEWTKGDLVDIVCEQASNHNGKPFEYEVFAVKNDQTADGKKTASHATLGKHTPEGLRWGDANVLHHFYAMYPNRKAYGNDPDATHVGFAPGGVQGFIPVERIIPKDRVVEDVQKNTIHVNPDMRFAFMAGKASVRPSEIQNERVPVPFQPLVNSYRFSFVCPDLNNIEGLAGKLEDRSILVRSVSILSPEGHPIAGNFEYHHNSNGKTVKVIDDAKKSARITLSFEQPVRLAENGVLDVHFFALPSVETMNSLKVQIMFDLADITFIKTATINMKLQARKKYFFKNLRPELKNINTTNWFSAVQDEVYINQLSFPAAGHVFSQAYSASDSRYKTQQVLNYVQLYQKGVRGFEMRNCIPEGGTDFAQFPFVCAGTILTNEIKFGEAFDFLAGELAKTENQRETLVLLLTYQSAGGDGGYNPKQYLNSLETFLSKKANADPRGKNMFSKLTENSTAADIRGKIAIIVRLADDDYCAMQNIDTKNLVPSADWKDYITVIDNWGTCIDNFDLRYGSGYYREAAFEKNGSGKKQFETEFLFRGTTNDLNNPEPTQWEITGPHKTPQEAFSAYPKVDRKIADYKVTFNQKQGNAVVQCWERVIPQSYHNKPFYTGASAVGGRPRATSYLWYAWPSSAQEKKDAIQYVLDEAIKTKGVRSPVLYFNCLSCFFGVPEDKFHGSMNPYTNLASGPSGRLSTPQQVTGGDYRAAAATFNTLVYDYLSPKKTSALGPLGFVMMDFIGAQASDFPTAKEMKTDYGEDKITPKHASKASNDLLRLIILNNFRFPLLYKSSTPSGGGEIGGDTDNPMGNGGDIISIE